VCGDEVEVRICEAALSRTEEECHPAVRGVRSGESVLGAEKTVASGTGVARKRRLLITGEPPKRAEDRGKPNPTLAPAWQDTYCLEDTGLFRVSLEIVLHTFTGGHDGGIGGNNIVADSAGNLYGTANVGGNQSTKCEPWTGFPGCGVVFKMSRNKDGSWKETVLHTF